MSFSWADKNEHHKKAITIALIIHALLLLWFIFTGMSIKKAEDEKFTGIVVNFGEADAGKRSKTPKTSESVPKKSTVSPASSSASSAASEPIIDQKIKEVKAENAISLSTEKKKKKDKSKKEDKKASENNNKKKNKTDNQQKSEVTKKVEETAVTKVEEAKPEVDDRALFTKKKSDKNDNAKPSQGTSERDLFTDQGKSTDNTANQESEEYGNPYSSALSSNGITANLRGRILKYIPEVKKRFQTNGKVVIKIKVDQGGQVIQVDQDISKSTTNDPALVKIALDTAKKAMFNQDFSASVRQSGSITFEFKVQ